ncbi:MAG TPA: hypothetical protein VFR23_01990 [Jiangellaceae bacterium]|nr:hypothetical protein [Jiangellaceae bacterium]
MALWAGGRAAEVGFLVSPSVGDPASQVGVVQGLLATLHAFAVGSAASRWPLDVLADGWAS